jgi:aminopeptidase
MNDPRYRRLAELLTGYSTALRRGDRVWIDAAEIPEDFVVELIRAVRGRGAEPFVHLHRGKVSREIARGSTARSLRFSLRHDLAKMQAMQAYIALRGSQNSFENSDVPAEKQKMAGNILRPISDRRINRTRWVVLRWPTPGMAQGSGMSTEAFEDLFFRVCSLDYRKMSRAVRPLVSLMRRTDKVHITGPGTDLRFSIRGIGVIPCVGERNIPDGEVFTAPVRKSVEGQVTFNAPAIYRGIPFDQVCLRFSKGKIIEATAAQKTRELEEIFSCDEGARYIGEFALGLNPHLQFPMRDILFDEKIAGSFHFTPGQAYSVADNGNRSQIHWDLVNLQARAQGGGRIFFDGKLVREDGRFVRKDLAGLNPERLAKVLSL